MRGQGSRLLGLDGVVVTDVSEVGPELRRICDPRSGKQLQGHHGENGSRQHLSAVGHVEFLNARHDSSTTTDSAAPPTRRTPTSRLQR